MATTVRARPERTSAPTTRARPRWLGGALVAVVLVGAGFRLWGLGANRLGYDEAFTAMAGRLPLGSLFGYLRAHDSHPPLDYLLHLPLARLGVSAFWFRMPGVLCSIAALGLFAWWMRDRGRVGVLATAIMACSAFEIVHGREARMYAELELLGVAVAVLAYAWLQAPRRRHAYLLGILVLLGLLTHVSMFLVGAGLLALPGRRRDREAWRWRGAIAAAGAGWAALWGSSFLVQARGGHSDWIPRTTPGRVVDTVSSLVTQDTAHALVIVLAVAAGGVLLVRSDRRMGRVWCACFVVPLTLAAVAGLAAPVLLDRTLTMVAWAPMLAIAVVLDRLLRRAPALGIAAVVVAGLLVLPPSFSALAGSTAPDRALRRLEAVARPGDVVAVRAAGKAPEVQWTLGVRGHQPWKPVRLTDVVPTVAGLRLGGAAPTGRIWILDWNSRVRAAPGYQRCAPDRHFGVSRILCLRRVDAD
jgi:Dolichyl-phosphate-mannose-protein mannosyltransferase